MELIIGFVGFLVFLLTMFFSKKMTKKSYRIITIMVGLLLSLMTIALISFLVDSLSVDLNYFSAKYYGIFILLYLVVIAKKSPIKKE